MPPRLVLIGLVVLAAELWSVAAYARERTGVAATQAIGACFLAIMVFTHVCEHFRWFPTLAWGEPDTAGHYIDLTSALLGISLLALGFIGRRIERRLSL